MEVKRLRMLRGRAAHRWSRLRVTEGMTGWCEEMRRGRRRRMAEAMWRKSTRRESWRRWAWVVWEWKRRRAAGKRGEGRWARVEGGVRGRV